jgi:TDG/mug DNA glycosylase family protein
VGHHFARPGNRFWAALHASGFTERKLSPEEEALLLGRGLGITNLVARATATADEIGPEELRRGARVLARKARRRRPGVVAFLGLGAFRVAFDSPGATVGPQAGVIGGARAWLLPNPSGLNAHYLIEDLARAFAALRAEVEGRATPSD